jgi:tRNA dimethylallyltransferase
MVTILGPTASGKTALAVALARHYDGEIISADSRQVYDELYLGVGKDLETYVLGGAPVSYHLIGHVSLATHYDLFSFKRDFQKAKDSILDRGKWPILCGGTGLYLESVLLNYTLSEVPEDRSWRVRAEQMSDTELRILFTTLSVPHNETDTADRNRLIRAIEIALATEQKRTPAWNAQQGMVFGIDWELEALRERIRFRLDQRLRAGMLDEVVGLLAAGVSAERLDQLGLEYRYCLKYLLGEMSLEMLRHLLGREICRYAKRQRTWFRRMEKRGVPIFWVSGAWPLEKQVTYVKKMVESTECFL